MDDPVLETISFFESTVFPQLAQQWRNEQSNEEQVLPNRLPLKRRLSEFRHGVQLPRRASSPTNSQAVGNFSGNLWAIERFRDITPALVVAIFEDSIVLEPGDVGPLPTSHPVARELIRCINTQTLSFAMLEKLREYGAPFYDGCVVVGIVDYRRWAFGSSATRMATTQATSPEVGVTTSTPSSSTPVPSTQTGPEMHKILLKLNYSVILTDINRALFENTESLGIPEILKGKEDFNFEIENPNPLVSKVMTSLNYDSKKFEAQMRPSTTNPNIGPLNSRDEEIMLQEALRTTRIEGFRQKYRLAQKNSGVSMIQQGRFRMVSLIDESRGKRNQIGAEPLYGLDARKDPARLGLNAAPSLSWLQLNQSLWRTMRFEDRSDSTTIRHVTVHVVIHLGNVLRSPSIPSTIPQGPSPKVRFDVLLRVGTRPCLGDISDSIKTSFFAKGPVELFVEQLKQSMSVEGKVCVADVSNPNALGGLIRGNFTEATLPAHILSGVFNAVQPINVNPVFMRPQAPMTKYPPHSSPQIDAPTWPGQQAPVQSRPPVTRSSQPDLARPRAKK